MNARASKLLKFSETIGHELAMSSVQFQRVSFLEKKAMVLLTAKQSACVDFAWSEHNVNLLLNKKNLSLIKVFRNRTIDPTHVLTNVNNNVIVYFKQNTSNVEFVFPSDNFSIKMIKLPYKVMDAVFSPMADDKVLLISKRSVVWYDYIKEKSEVIYTDESVDMTHIEEKPKDSILRVFSGEKILVISLEEKRLIETIDTRLEPEQVPADKVDDDNKVIAKEEAKDIDANSLADTNATNSENELESNRSGSNGSQSSPQRARAAGLTAESFCRPFRLNKYLYQMRYDGELKVSYLRSTSGEKTFDMGSDL